MSGSQIRVRALSGDVAVVGTVTSPDPDHTEAPAETEGERTQPMPRITPARELWWSLYFPARDWWRRMGRSTKTVAVLVLAVLGVLVLRGIDDGTSTAPVSAAAATSTSSSPSTASSAPTPTATPATEVASATAPQRPSPEQLLALPAVALGQAIPGVPADPAPSSDPGTEVLHPEVDEVAVYLEPGGAAFARLPRSLFAAPTWVPVVDRRPGWVLVLLPGAVNSDGISPAGWIHLGPDVGLGRVDRRIRIDLSAGTAAVSTELGRVTLADTGAAAGSGRRSFIVVSTASQPRWWPLAVWWPALVDPERVCRTLSGGIVIPGLPTTSPLGQVDDRGCLTTPGDLKSALSAAPAGTVVVVR